MKQNRAIYQSYLLRLYGSSQDGKQVWRASLENPMSGEQMHFSSLDLLFQFLADQCAAARPAGAARLVSPEDGFANED